MRPCLAPTLVSPYNNDAAQDIWLAGQSRAQSAAKKSACLGIFQGVESLRFQITPPSLNYEETRATQSKIRVRYQDRAAGHSGEGQKGHSYIHRSQLLVFALLINLPTHFGQERGASADF